MKQFWKQAAALTMTACLSLSILAPAALAVEPSVPQVTREHVRYMQGHDNGTFAPGDALTRAQGAQMVLRLLTDPQGGTQPAAYADVDPGAWYGDAVLSLRAWGLFDPTATFRPNDIMTRAEFVDLLTRLYPQAAGSASFSDVPASHWAAAQIGAAVSLGWITGYPDGTFGPERGLTRAEACTVINRMMGRAGDPALAAQVMGLGLYRDVPGDHWAAATIAEASVSHTPQTSGGGETWSGVELSALTFTPGIHEIRGALYYVDKFGKLATDTAVGAYRADGAGVLTLVQEAWHLTGVPYHSQIDDLYAWVGCESVATFSGLQAKGYALEEALVNFVKGQPRSPTTDPEKGFVGDPFVPDPSKTTRTTIYPAKLAEYANTYCRGENACADFRGATLTDLQRELLAGNCVVGYMTLWWAQPFYRNYTIEGQTQSLVSNNHAVLVCGYDPAKGYLISDPYNYYNRGQVYQYWEPANIFEPIWTQRKVGMIIR